MTPEQIRTLIRQFLSQHFHLSGDRAPGDDESLLASQRIDSLGVADIVLYLEDELGVTVEDDDLTPENFDSIDSLCRFVEERRR